MSTPIVTIFVRHKADCKYAGDEFEKRCNCRKHLRWSHNGKQHRKTAGTRSWAQAEISKANLQAQLSGQPLPNPEQARLTLEDAITVFKADKKNQGFTEDIQGRYARELERLQTYCERKGIFTLQSITRELLVGYQETWADLYPSTNTRLAVQARLRNFLRFCFDSKWIDRIPKTSRIKVEAAPTLPLTAKEYQHLLATVPKSFPDAQRAARVRGLIQTMRWSGLAIRDAVTLRRDEIVKEKSFFSIVTSRQKTGTHVSVPIPLDVGQEILAVLNGNDRYVFWSTGTGKEQSAVTNWQHDLRKLFRDAGIKSKGNMLSHRLRDTFAVDLLEKGVPLEEVSKLLGHESIKTTERHYAKWVKGRQDRLNKLVTATWK